MKLEFSFGIQLSQSLERHWVLIYQIKPEMDTSEWLFNRDRYSNHPWLQKGKMSDELVSEGRIPECGPAATCHLHKLNLWTE